MCVGEEESCRRRTSARVCLFKTGGGERDVCNAAVCAASSLKRWIG